MDVIRSTGGTLASFLRQVIGTYTPLTYPDGSPVTTIAGVDWEYIVSACCLILTIFFIFKIIGLLFRHS